MELNSSQAIALGMMAGIVSWAILVTTAMWAVSA